MSFLKTSNSNDTGKIYNTRSILVVKGPIFVLILNHQDIESSLRLNVINSGHKEPVAKEPVY